MFNDDDNSSNNNNATLQSNANTLEFMIPTFAVPVVT